MVTAHDSPEHRCTWACPDADPLADIRELRRDAESGMTLAELEARHDHGPADREAVYRELGGTEELPSFQAYFGYVYGQLTDRLQRGTTNG